MSDQSTPFSPNYITQSPTTAATPVPEPKASVFEAGTERVGATPPGTLVPFRRYGTGKPRREITKATITRG